MKSGSWANNKKEKNKSEGWSYTTSHGFDSNTFFRETDEKKSESEKRAYQPYYASYSDELNGLMTLPSGNVIPVSGVDPLDTDHIPTPVCWMK